MRTENPHQARGCERCDLKMILEADYFMVGVVFAPSLWCVRIYARAERYASTVITEEL